MVLLPFSFFVFRKLSNQCTIIEEVSELSATAITFVISLPLTVNAPYRFCINTLAVVSLSLNHHFPVSGLLRLPFLPLLLISLLAKKKF